MTHYQTLAAEHRREPPKTRGSRFLAVAAPTRSREEVQRLLERLRAEHPAATHHCYAFRLGADGANARAQDDGEPAGSAGRPILQQLRGHHLTDATVVVVRYFGGTKLGVGGLQRAYGGAAREVLESAPVVRVVVRRGLAIEFPYECSRPVEALLSRFEVETDAASYDEVVRLRLRVPGACWEEFLGELTERCAGRVNVQVGD